MMNVWIILMLVRYCRVDIPVVVRLCSITFKFMSGLKMLIKSLHFNIASSQHLKLVDSRKVVLTK
jgi:hypothetical protein